MQHDSLLAPISQEGKKILDLVKVDRKQASMLMESLSIDEQVTLVSRQAIRDPRGAQELLFLLDDEKSKDIVDELGDKTVFRIMKSQSSTHIGMLPLIRPDRIQSVLDLDQELFSTKGATDPVTAYHWMVSFLEEDDENFARLLLGLDIKVVASAFQDKILRPWAQSAELSEDDEQVLFPADFLVRLDQGELKPEDLEVADEETLDILSKIHLADPVYFNELVSLMVREEDLKTRSAEEAFDRIHQQVGDIAGLTQEAEDMFVPLEE